MRCHPHHRSSHTLLLISGLFCLLVFTASPYAADQDNVEYERALKLARGGHLDSALTILRQLTAQFPEEEVYLFDYIAVLGWAEQDSEVLSLQSRLDLAGAPPYVLETLGRSARNTEDGPSAIRFYSMAVHRAPDRVESRLGLALSHADNGNTKKAIAILNRLNKKHPKQIGILEALAYTHQSIGNTFDELAVIQDILDIDPGHRESRYRRILIATQLGVPHLAADMAKKTPAFLSTEVLETIIGDQAVQSVRWGRLYNPFPQSRYDDTDNAIQLLQNQLDRLEIRDQVGSTAYQRARFDLITALRDRNRMLEVISQVEDLQSENAEIPDYVLIAAADAYMNEGRPRVAHALYQKILEHNPNDFDISIARFYALFDIGEYSAALSFIDALAAAQKEPSRKLRAESVAIMGYAWSEQLSKAQKRLEPLIDRAPNNPYLLSDLGFVFLWRGWPRRAMGTFRLSKTIDPEVLDAQIGMIEAARDLSEFHQEKQGLSRLQESNTDNRQVLRLGHDHEIHHMRELRVEVSGSNSSSGLQEGSRDLALDITLYSRPINDHYRVFGHSHNRKSRFPEGTGTYRRLGAGVEYRVRDIEIVGELSGGYSQDAGLGLNLHADWMPDDFWTFGAHVDTYSNEVPLRGRLNEDVDGRSIGLNADYRFHESRAIGLGIQRLMISDQNRRTTYFATLFQRFIQGPSYKLEGQLGIYGSRNTLSDASYFNPGRDLSTELGLTNEWLIFRHIRRSLIHRLGLTLGSYYQSGFGSNGFWGINYEHRWKINDRLNLGYGLGHSRPVYDGVSESMFHYHLNLDWRF